uniref:Uncharacterized protein n=1 Tax=Glossina austeni TaxID=7395 RepID=A0A1A9V5L9_GLOAU
MLTDEKNNDDNDDNDDSDSGVQSLQSSKLNSQRHAIIVHSRNSGNDLTIVEISMALLMALLLIGPMVSLANSNRSKLEQCQRLCNRSKPSLMLSLSSSLFYNSEELSDDPATKTFPFYAEVLEIFTTAITSACLASVNVST